MSFAGRRKLADLGQSGSRGQRAHRSWVCRGFLPLEPDGLHDLHQFAYLLLGRLGHELGVHDEAGAVDVDDPQPVDLPGALLVPIRRPARRGPAPEGRLAAGSRTSRSVKSASSGTDHSSRLPWWPWSRPARDPLEAADPSAHPVPRVGRLPVRSSECENESANGQTRSPTLPLLSRARSPVGERSGGRGSLRWSRAARRLDGDRVDDRRELCAIRGRRPPLETGKEGEPVALDIDGVDPVRLVGALHVSTIAVGRAHSQNPDRGASPLSTGQVAMSVATVSSTYFPLYPSTVTSVSGPAVIPGWPARAGISSSMPRGSSRPVDRPP